MIDFDYAKLVCKLGGGSRTCRYLVTTDTGFGCAKYTDGARLIDQHVDDGIYVAVGDNCEGKLFDEIDDVDIEGEGTCLN